jgi:plasmid stabilization system protein ParE
LRRFVLPRFPYSLIYRHLGADEVRILAVAHQKRRPRYWTGRR